jgi:hypothetical protein
VRFPLLFGFLVFFIFFDLWRLRRVPQPHFHPVEQREHDTFSAFAEGGTGLSLDLEGIAGAIAGEGEEKEDVGLDGGLV